MHATESWSISNQAAGTYPVTMGNQGGGINSGRNYVYGGMYSLDIACTGSPTLELQKLGPDGVTYLSLYFPFNNAGTEADLIVGKMAAVGSKNIFLAPGIYRVVVSVSTANFISLTRVPVSS